CPLSLAYHSTVTQTGSPPLAESHLLFSYRCDAPRALSASPTRRSSDLSTGAVTGVNVYSPQYTNIPFSITPSLVGNPTRYGDNTDRKSTRLNSSHVSISYAVFCLKTKTVTVTV